MGKESAELTPEQVREIQAERAQTAIVNALYLPEELLISVVAKLMQHMSKEAIEKAKELSK